MAFNHTTGELFVLLNALDGEVFPLTLGERNQTRFYRGVGSGQLFEDAEEQTLVSEHRALKPYAPGNVSAVEDVSNNIDIAWVRRTRVGGQLQDLLAEVPLAEDSEEYELEILDGPGGSIVRTVTSLTTPAYEYLNADIVTDLGSVPAQLTVRVYQISAQVGRGFTREVTVDVE